MKNVSSNEKYILKLKIYHQIKNISSNKQAQILVQVDALEILCNTL